MAPKADPPLLALDAMLRTGTSLRRVADLLGSVTEKLTETDAAMAWDVVPLDWFEGRVPEGIASCWVFAVRAGAETGAERHANSHQRSLSLVGRGEFQLHEGGSWLSHPLISDPSAPLDRRWVSIPENTWHRLVVGDENWGMLSFHTVAADELVEETPADPDDLHGSIARRHYASGERP